ncbi:MAG: PhoH family protein, partial [Pseudomonadales bacterium]
MNSSKSINFSLSHIEPEAFASLCGQYNEHLKLIEKRLNVIINNRGQDFQVTGDSSVVEKVADLLKQLYKEACEGRTIDLEQVHLCLQQSGIEQNTEINRGAADENLIIHAHKLRIKPRGPNQQKYVRSIFTHDINFGIGPAGTGKTYLAVACAVEALDREEIERILLVRPAVEAGEKLGFLPGDLSQKVDPYLRPLYDALFEMLG